MKIQVFPFWGDSLLQLKDVDESHSEYKTFQFVHDDRQISDLGFNEQQGIFIKECGHISASSFATFCNGQNWSNRQSLAHTSFIWEVCENLAQNSKYKMVYGLPNGESFEKDKLLYFTKDREYIPRCPRRKEVIAKDPSRREVFYFTDALTGPAHWLSPTGDVQDIKMLNFDPYNKEGNTELEQALYVMLYSIDQFLKTREYWNAMQREAYLDFLWETYIEFDRWLPYRVEWIGESRELQLMRERYGLEA